MSRADAAQGSFRRFEGNVFSRIAAAVSRFFKRLGRGFKHEADELHYLEEVAKGKLFDWLGSPEVMRAAFTVLRRHKPILLAQGKAVVTRNADVTEVLQQDAFGVTETYAAKMARTTGAFFLGMEENTPQYQREVAVSRKAVPPQAVERVRTLIGEYADELLAQAKPRGRLDVVEELSHRVPLRMVERLFGVPGPDPETMQRWMRIIFWEIFLNLSDDPKVAQQAEAASRELAVYLDTLIAERKQTLSTTQADDLLTRMLKLQGEEATRLDDDGVRRNVGGIIVGAVDTTSKAIAFALDSLLRHPQALAEAQQAALADDDAKVAAYVFEALRFNPHNPLILRTAHRDYVLAKGTERETLIPKGTTVVAATLSAMFDDAVFPQPDTFRTDRPPERYMHFGRGMHTCFGERLNLVTVPQVLKRVLKLKNLRRASGPDGQLQHEGPFPSHLVVEFDPA